MRWTLMEKKTFPQHAGSWYASLGHKVSLLRQEQNNNALQNKNSDSKAQNYQYKILSTQKHLLF